MYYISCPDCRRKVIDEGHGFRCENCNKTQPTMIPTYMLTAKVSDVSGSLFIQFPRELGDPIMNGMTADQFRHFKEDNTPEALKELVRQCQFNVRSFVYC